MTDSRLENTALVGSIRGVPVYISYWTLIYVVFSVIHAPKLASLPVWFGYVFVLVSQLLLQLTVLVHEFGHGLMAVYVGGKIDKILLWPFGGICFSSVPRNGLTSSRRLSNNIKVVLAGPLSHLFIQGPFWAVLLKLCFRDVHLWSIVNPVSGTWDIPTSARNNVYTLLLFFSLSVALSINISLFIFNMFFPMYPMDAAQLLVSVLLKAGNDIYAAASKLMVVSGVCCLLFINYGLGQLEKSNYKLNASISLAMGGMCIFELLHIYRLGQARMLHLHPLFVEKDEGDAGTRLINPGNRQSV